MRRRLTIVSFAAAGCCAAVISVASVLPASGTAGPAAGERRPDLVQRTPTGISVRELDGRFALGFDSAVENRGDGPLMVHGHRAPGEPDMTADQLVVRADGSRRRLRGVGVIRYTRSGGHDHWHFLKAVRYELRRLSDHALVRPDRKTGFCL